MPFQLAIVVSSNPINFINVHSLHQKPAHWQNYMDYCSQLWQAEMAFIVDMYYVFLIRVLSLHIYLKFEITVTET